MNIRNFCLYALMFFVLGFGTKTGAESFVPKEIKLFTPDVSYEAGTLQDFAIVSSDELVRLGTVFEYGVARKVKAGFTSSFEILSTETTANTSAVRMSVKIPNITDTYATSTYVIYVKSYVPNDPESENFFVTKTFSILRNETPFILVKNINLLQSNGTRFSLTAGPTIYNPETTTNRMNSVGTSVEVTFQSNQDVVLKPIITFTKLRSASSAPEYVPQDIVVKKGDTYITIPLPTFGYEPGVYVGQIDFKNDLLPTKLHFQYIVAGETASIGQIHYTQQGLFTFNIFGTPKDVYQDVLTSSSDQIHTVRTIFLVGGKEKFATTTDINFASSTYSLSLPSKIKKIESVRFEVVSKKTGKMLYQDEKSVDFANGKTSSMWFVYYIVFMLLLIIFAYKRHKIRFIITLILFMFLMVGQNAFGESWNPGSDPNNVIGYALTRYKTENYSSVIQVYFNEDLTRKTFTCGEPLTFMFKVEYEQCANTVAGLAIGFSTVSSAASESALVQTTSNQSGVILESQVLTRNSGVHYFYRNTTNFLQYEGPVVSSSMQKLYVTVSSILVNPTYVDQGWTKYSIPLTVSSCSACTNAPSASNIPNFQAYGRNYYFAPENGNLYFKDISGPAVPSYCGIDMCSDTTAIESSIPSDKTWVPSTPSYSSSLSRYACVPFSVTCSCSGRNRVCTNSATGAKSTDVAHSSCALQAYCSASYDISTNTGTVNFGAYNTIGTLSFSPSGNPVVMQDLSPGTVSVTKTVTDSFDMKTSSATCNLDQGTGVSTADLLKSTIQRFYANPKIVNQGAACRFGWETNNMKSCTIDGTSVSVNMNAGDLNLGGYQISTPATGDQNILKTLTCLGNVQSGPAPVFSTVATCYVRPRFREN